VCLKVLAESNLNITNIIIHTDEQTIPWHLAYSEYRPDFDFLCNKYPCGTILVEESAEALRRFIKDSKRSQQPQVSQASKREICLIAGELGRDAPGGGDLGMAYIERLREFLQRFEMPVRCIGPDNWAHCEGKTKRVIHKLDEIFEQAQIVHFTCHVVQDKLRLTRNLILGPDDLAGLSDLAFKPLVVLHGCASAGPSGPGGEGARLCRAFLEKGAGGCLATVFPVNIPTVLLGGAETLIEDFYKNVFALDTYGLALYKARRSFQQRSPSKEEPQALFYQLFGDPRETLFTNQTVTQADRIMWSEQEEKPQPLELHTVRISGEGLDHEAVLHALEGVDGVVSAKPQRSAVGLCVDAGAPTLVVELLIAIPLGMIYEQYIAEFLEKKLHIRGIHVETGNPPRHFRS
jgi:CHAT domain-containing protein